MGWSRLNWALISAAMLGCGRAQQASPNSPATTQTQLPMPSPRPSSAPNITVCPHSGAKRGIDVSDYDPNIQWGAVRNAGYAFALIKATEGVTLKNSRFNSDWASTRKAGIVRGAYHFFHPADDPQNQAKHFLATVGALQPYDLPPVLDWEVTDGVSATVQISNAQIWLNEVESATGKTPMIYVAPFFWNQLGNPQQFVRYPLYIANYDVKCPDIPPPWSQWAFWQSGIGPVPGVQSAQADNDVFNGFLMTHFIPRPL